MKKKKIQMTEKEAREMLTNFTVSLFNGMYAKKAIDDTIVSEWKIKGYIIPSAKEQAIEQVKKYNERKHYIELWQEGSNIGEMADYFCGCLSLIEKLVQDIKEEKL